MDSDLCSHTGLLAAAAAPASHTRLWGLRFQSQLAPVSGAPLSSALNPLSSRTRKQRGKKKSLASSAGPDFFPDSLPASCGALAPSGCVHAANPSPLLTIRPKPKPQLPAPARLPRWVSRQSSRAGECRSAPILCAGISSLCPTQVRGEFLAFWEV